MFCEMCFLFGGSGFSLVDVVLTVEVIVAVRVSRQIFNWIKWMNSDKEKLEIIKV